MGSISPPPKNNPQQKSGQHIGEQGSGIRCPKISCQLHGTPDIDCRVQSYFVYRGITCKGCIEDSCAAPQPTTETLIGQGNHPHRGSTDHALDHHHGVRPLRKSLIGVSSIMSGRHNIRFMGNRMVILDPSSFIQRNARLLQRLTQRRPIHSTAVPQIRCPKLHCHLHHQPEPHCVVESYFMYRGIQCTGCQEDICLGAKSVPDALIGETHDLSTHSNEHIMNTNSLSRLTDISLLRRRNRNHLPQNIRLFDNRRRIEHLRNHRFRGDMQPQPTTILQNRSNISPTSRTPELRNVQIDTGFIKEQTSGNHVSSANQEIGIIDKMEMEPHHHQPSPLAQANDQSKSQPSSSIRCPELSCHLHQRPNTDCSVQTFFVYHGVTCESCVEDVCSDHHPHGIGFRGIPPSGLPIDCPKVKCHTHHTPDPHCIVETYFMYHDRRCTGCDEDICLGAQAVPESLIGESTTDHHVNEGHLHHNTPTAMTDSRPSVEIGNNILRDRTLSNWKNAKPKLDSGRNTGKITVQQKPSPLPSPLPVGGGKALSRYTGQARSYLQGLFHPLFSRGNQ